MTQPAPRAARLYVFLSKRPWRWSSLALLSTVWAVLQLGGLFSPGLLDDVDSVYTQIAREMLGRHDFVTPYIDGIRFFDKPPLMYWMAAGSMRLFGWHDWAARLPLALGVLALLFAVYALGIRFFAGVSPANAPDRGGLYAALALATSIGPYLYTRFYIPDILIALWMTLAIHLFLIALDRLGEGRSAFAPMLGFGVVMGLDVLTKGLIGVVFPVGFVLLYLALTHRLRLLLQLHVIASTLAFLLVAAPWHILAAIRNPPVPMPAGVGLPARAGWTWFYLYNEHVARFLGKRIPHDYGQVPIPLFWLLLFLWLIPWAAFLPAALLSAWRNLRAQKDSRTRFDSDIAFSHAPDAPRLDSETWADRSRSREAALTCLLWAAIVLGFFTLSSRQEYYHLPALPALALLAGGLLAAADRQSSSFRLHPERPGSPASVLGSLGWGSEGPPNSAAAARPQIESPAALDQRRSPLSQALRGSLYMLVPLGALLFVICGVLAITSPTPQPGLTLNAALSSNPDLYNLSLGHVFDLTGKAMGFFRGPLAATALGMLTLGPIAWLIRRKGRTYAANLTLAAGMTVVLMAAHEGLARFYPILGSKDLADVARAEYSDDNSTLMIIDGELTSGSSLLFYTNDTVMLLNGRVNGPWFGSFWPDARKIFLNDADLAEMWGHRPLMLMTYHPEQRVPELCRVDGLVVQLASIGGKTLLTNGITASVDGKPPSSSSINLCK